MSNLWNDLKPLTSSGFPQPLIETDIFEVWDVSILMLDPNLVIYAFFYE